MTELEYEEEIYELIQRASPAVMGAYLARTEIWEALDSLVLPVAEAASYAIERGRNGQ